MVTRRQPQAYEDLTPAVAAQRGTPEARGEVAGAIADLGGPSVDFSAALAERIAELAAVLKSAVPSASQQFANDPDPGASEVFHLDRVPARSVQQVGAIAAVGKAAATVIAYVDDPATGRVVAAFSIDANGTGSREFPALWLRAGQRLALVVAGSSAVAISLGVTGAIHST